MTLEALSKYVCWTGIGSMIFAFPTSFISFPQTTLDYSIHVAGLVGLLIFLFASALLWILDWILLARTWGSRDILSNLGFSALMLIGTLLAAYAIYFILRNARSSEPDLRSA
jgi:hypothetical protein